MRLQTSLAKLQLLIIDELGYVPLSQTGAELLFEVISQRYERGSTIVTSNLAFEDWTSVFGVMLKACLRSCLESWCSFTSKQTTCVGLHLGGHWCSRK